jgi:hypothetical protein
VVNYDMRARVLRSRGEDLAGAADVDEAQPGQLEVNVTRSAAEFLAERVAKRGTAVMSASPARSSPRCPAIGPMLSDSRLMAAGYGPYCRRVIMGAHQPR